MVAVFIWVAYIATVHGMRFWPFLKELGHLGALLVADLGKALNSLERRHKYARRRKIVRDNIFWSMSVRDMLRSGLTSNQLYLLALARRRERRCKGLYIIAITLTAYTTALMVAQLLAVAGVVSAIWRVSYATLLMTTVVLFSVAAVALVYGVCKNLRGNLGGRLASLAFDTLLLTQKFCLRPDLYMRSGLASLGSGGVKEVRETRRKLRENCWTITMWTADLVGRSRSEYTHKGVSSFPRFLLWASEKGDQESFVTAYIKFIDVVRMIDQREIDFTLDDVDSTSLGVPQMERPSALVRIQRILRRMFSLQRISLLIGIGGGVATILSFFKVSFV